MICAMPFSPFDRGPFPRQRGRFRLIPVRTLVPNLITLLALCAGLTAIRLALEDKLEWAVAAIVFAALLDGIDGRVARMLKGTSRFGAELDSLADFVNFGVAPALMLYFWGLRELGNLGWIAGLVFAISTGLRLARFNVMVEDPNKPAWAAKFFMGVPAPAGAMSARTRQARELRRRAQPRSLMRTTRGPRCCPDMGDKPPTRIVAPGSIDARSIGAFFNDATRRVTHLARGCLIHGRAAADRARVSRRSVAHRSGSGCPGMRS